MLEEDPSDRRIAGIMFGSRSKLDREISLARLRLLEASLPEETNLCWRCYCKTPVSELAPIQMKRGETVETKFIDKLCAEVIGIDWHKLKYPNTTTW